MVNEKDLKTDISSTDVETQTIPKTDLEKARSNGKVHGDPFFIIE